MCPNPNPCPDSCPNPCPSPNPCPDMVAMSRYIRCGARVRIAIAVAKSWSVPVSVGVVVFGMSLMSGLMVIAGDAARLHGRLNPHSYDTYTSSFGLMRFCVSTDRLA